MSHSDSQIWAPLPLVKSRVAHLPHSCLQEPQDVWTGDSELLEYRSDGGHVLTLMVIIPTAGAPPKSDEAITIFMKWSRAINMLMRAWCGRKYFREIFLSSEAFFCKVNKSPELAFLYKVTFHLLDLL